MCRTLWLWCLPFSWVFACVRGAPALGAQAMRLSRKCGLKHWALAAFHGTRRWSAILLRDQSAWITLGQITFTFYLSIFGCVCTSERLQRGQTERRGHIVPSSLGHFESGHGLPSCTQLSHGDNLWHLSPFSCPLGPTAVESSGDFHHLLLRLLWTHIVGTDPDTELLVFAHGSDHLFPATTFPGTPWKNVLFI